jgi:hypothetical protein
VSDDAILAELRALRKEVERLADAVCALVRLQRVRPAARELLTDTLATADEMAQVVCEEGTTIESAGTSCFLGRTRS